MTPLTRSRTVALWPSSTASSAAARKIIEQ
jgi:hypothetical protein